MSSAPKVLLIDTDRAHARRVERVIRAAGADVEHSLTLDVDLAQPSELVVINYSGLTPTAREQLDAVCGQSAGHQRLVLYKGESDRDDIASLLARYGLTNLLADADVETDQLFVTVQKILRRDIFGVAKYFPWGVPILERRLTASMKRGEVIDDARAFATDLGIGSRFVEQYAMVVEELASNALYDAPTDADGAFRYAHVSRTEAVSLTPTEEVVVTLACDGRTLGLGVSDPFGSLQIPRVIEYLCRCFRREADQIEQKAGGAGIGLYHAFASLSSFVINLSPAVTTEVIGLLDIRGTYRDFAARGKSFNVFVLDPDPISRQVDPGSR